MNLSDLIKRLEEIKAEHSGDLPVYIDLDWTESLIDKPGRVTVKEAGETSATGADADCKRVVI